MTPFKTPGPAKASAAAAAQPGRPFPYNEARARLGEVGRMDPEVVALFRELADRSPAERNACYAQRQTPAAVRAEVESLLGHDRQPGLELTVVVAAAAEEALLKDPSTPPSSGRSLAPGVQVGSYQVVSMLGVGGMDI